MMLYQCSECCSFVGKCSPPSAGQGKTAAALAQRKIGREGAGAATTTGAYCVSSFAASWCCILLPFGGVHVGCMQAGQEECRLINVLELLTARNLQ